MISSEDPDGPRAWVDALLALEALEYIKESNTDPNKHRSSGCGYCALNIGASCSESPAIMSRPVGDRDRITKDREPRAI